MRDRRKRECVMSALGWLETGATTHAPDAHIKRAREIIQQLLCYRYVAEMQTTHYLRCIGADLHHLKGWPGVCCWLVLIGLWRLNIQMQRHGSSFTLCRMKNTRIKLVNFCAFFWWLLYLFFFSRRAWAILFFNEVLLSPISWCSSGSSSSSAMVRLFLYK